jgi:hypothetical protein
MVLCAVAAPAAADSKTKELARGYEKELAACQTRADGVTKVATGTQALVDGGQKRTRPISRRCVPGSRRCKRTRGADRDARI